MRWWQFARLGTGSRSNGALEFCGGMGAPKRCRNLVGRLRPRITINGPKRQDLPNRSPGLRGTELQADLFDRGSRYQEFKPIRIRD